LIHVNPADLHLPPSRLSGADPAKLTRQISRFGRSVQGMPPVLLYRGADDAYMLYDGVTRATRAAKLAPGTLIPAEIQGTLRTNVRQLPRVKDRLP
jgi:hypothetical protein